MKGYLCPHPPIIVPEVGKGEELKISQTLNSLKQVAKEIKEEAPETIIVITPHGPVFSDAIALSNEETISGDLADFRASEVKMNFSIDNELTEEIMKQSEEDGVQTIGITKDFLKDFRRPYQLDHGTMVPLHFIREFYKDFKLVHITYGMLNDESLYRFGKAVKKAIENTKRNTVVIASGDLSHRLTEDGPYSYSPKGSEFDEKILTYLKNGSVNDIFQMDKRDIEEAGECGYRSIIILLGVLGQFKGELLSYEGTFGVGYAVMRFTILDKEKSYLSDLLDYKNKKFNVRKENADDYVKLARASLEYYFENDEILPLPENISDELKNEEAGVFVSLKKDGQLRGCIGTFLPTTDCIGEEIIRNAVEAAINDPRFMPVRVVELVDISISVDVLSTPTKAKKEELDPQKYGVIVSKGRKRGLLLPMLEGVDTISKQLEIACEKAGINPNDDYEIEKFLVERHAEGEY